MYKPAGIKYFIVITCLLATVPALGQDDELPVNPTTDRIIVDEKIPDVTQSFRGGFKLPTIFGNRSFRKAMEGVGNIEFYYQYPVYKGLMLGGGVNGNYYDINFTALPELNTGNYMSGGAFGLIGLEKFVTPRFYVMMHQKAGYQVFRFKTPNCAAMSGDKHVGNSLFLESQVGIYATGGERISYGLIVGYQVAFFNFGPQWVCKETFSGLVADDYKGNAVTVNVGFGFSVALGKLQ